MVALPVVTGATGVVVSPATAAVDPCTPLLNPVACENSKPGSSPLDWYVPGTGDTNIQGYSTSMSVNSGETIAFKIKTPSTSYHIDIFRFGYYGGLGARKQAANIRPTATLPQSQPACQTFSDTGLIDCGNWAQSASWAVPSTAVSGLYMALLTRDDVKPTSQAIGVSQIPFVVRNDSSTSTMVVQTSDETWQAYNNYGGNSLYSCTVSCPPGNPLGYKAAFKVSYNRPYLFANNNEPNFYPYTEYPMIFFLEQNGYDVSYISGLDTSTKPSLLLNHKVFMSSGHDEYWTGNQRSNVENARDHGVSLAFFSGNELFWRTRWEPSQAGATTPNRTLVSYKDTHFNAPTDPVEWTGATRDPRFGTATGGGKPENALSGQIFLVNAGTTDIKVPANYAKLRLWRNTAVANLTGSQSVTLGAGLGTLGYEWDVDADDGFRPAGLIQQSSTTFAAPEVFTDYGTSVAPSTQTHHLTMYKAPSGAIVFGAGTVQWAWGLSGAGTVQWAWGLTGSRTDVGPDKNMQQATVNILADMGAQPATLMPTLVAATSSTDQTAPTSVITTPAPGATVADGTSITVSGTSSDAGGGVVAGVEVSTDNGSTWHPATGTTNWTYSWVAHGNPSATLKVRATDDSGNIESTPPFVSLGVTCPCSIFGSTAPTSPDSGDATAGELGIKFKADAPGTVTGIRFFKATANTGTHTGSLWSASGTLLATATFTNETASGWQNVAFSTPVTVTPGTVYVASYYAPKGHYSESAGYMYNSPSPQPLGSVSLDSGNLHALRNVPGTDNGLYKYSSSSTFPTNTFNAENYWVDVNFVPTGTGIPQVTGTSPAAGASGVALAATPTATLNQAVTGSSIAMTVTPAGGPAVAGTVAYNTTTHAATFTPSSALSYGTTYTVAVSGATNSGGQAMAAPFSWSFTTVQAPPAPTVTATYPSANAAGVDLAAVPSATFSQAVIGNGINFALSSAGGVAVPGTVAYNSATQTATFAPTSALAYGTTYTATVAGATNGTGQAMTAPFTWTFSTVPIPAPPVVTTTAPVAGATGVPVTAAPTATFDQAVDASSPTVAMTGPGGVAVSGTSNYNSTTHAIVFTPSAALDYSTTYSVAVSGATNATGQVMATPAVWTFTTQAAPPAPTVSSVTPSTGSSNTPLTTAPSATFSQQVTAASINFTLKAGSGQTVPTTTSYNSSSQTATFTPAGPLAYGTTYTATVTTATNATGQPLAAPFSWTFTTMSAPLCPCSVFSSSSVPAVASENDHDPVELGMKFSTSSPGYVTGIRFYKGSQNTGTHTGYLWSGTGSLLASVTFTNETATGWQQANLSTPVYISSGTTYVVSYWAPNGGYATTLNYFTSAVNNTPLQGLANGADGPNGVYRYGDTSFPTASFNSSNYWVDVAFSATSMPDPAVSRATPANNSTSAPPNTTPTAVFNQSVTASSISFVLKDAQGQPVAGSISYATGTFTATFTPAVPLAYNTTYTATVSGAANGAGGTMAAPFSWSFQTAAAPNCPCSVFAASSVPTTQNTVDPAAVELGMKFQSDVAGSVTGIRFYKGSQNTGTHTGYLWSGTGSLLASVTFTNESASGWQTATLSVPVAITPGATYVVSYFAPKGNYSSSSGYFNSSSDAAPLHAPDTISGGGNGVYRYGDASFPTSTFNATNYWVDVVFATS